MNWAKDAITLIFFVTMGVAHLCGASILQEKIASGQTPESEGWRWAEGFNYEHHLMDQQITQETFQRIHEKMQKAVGDLKDAIWSKEKVKKLNNPNINILRISFIVTSLQPNLQSQIYETELFKDHVFMSGTVPPTTRRKFSCLTRYAFSRSKLETEEPYSKNPVSKAIIDPPLHDLSYSNVIARLQSRYRLADQTKLTKVAQLAMKYKDLSNSDEVLNWISDADASLAVFLGEKEKASKEDAPVFFMHLHDSEQKVLYYLDHISEWMALYPSLKDNQSLFSLLEKTIESMMEFFSGQKTYIARQVRALMDSVPQEEDSEKEEKVKTSELNIDSTIRTLSNLIRIRSEAFTNVDDKQYLSVMADCVKTLSECANYFIEEKLERRDLTIDNIRSLQRKQLPQEIDILNWLSTLFVLLENARPRTAALKEEIKIWKKWVDKLKAIWFSTSDDSDNIEQTLAYLRRLHISLKSDSTVKEYKSEPFPKEFIDAVKKCLSDVGGDTRISGMILHIHSTNDVCYTCAPDLAEESVRPDGFAYHFCQFIEGMNPENATVSFQIINSCDSIRPCRKYTRTSVAKPMVFDSRPQGIRFYQHVLETPPQKEEPLMGQSEYKIPVMQASNIGEEDNSGTEMNKGSLEGNDSSIPQGQGTSSLGDDQTDPDADINDKEIAREKKLALEIDEGPPLDLSWFD